MTIKRMPNLLTQSQIPASVPKKKRAQLIKLQQEKVRNQLKRYFLCFDPIAMKAVTPFNLSAEPCAMTQGFADILGKIEVKWKIHCYILGREKNGKHAITCEVLCINTPCSHSQISDLAADFHWDMIQEYRTTRRAPDFITAAWIATLADDIDSDLAMRIFEKAGSFDALADWEEEKLNVEQQA